MPQIGNFNFYITFFSPGINGPPHMVSRWEWIFKKQKETKPRNFIYIFNILFSYLHFVPPLHFHFHLKFKKKKKKSQPHPANKNVVSISVTSSVLKSTLRISVWSGNKIIFDLQIESGCNVSLQT